MKSIFLIHGSYGNPDNNWFPWLKSELEKLGYNVIVPKFPTPKNQSLKTWQEAFREYEKYINKDTIFIGHSLGPAFILDILERLEISINSAFFVSGFISFLNDPDFDEINKTFVDRDFDWEKIKKNCDKFTIYHSDNDPYVPMKIAKYFANKLNCKIVEIKNAGHFNKDSGYDKFELLFRNITKK